MTFAKHDPVMIGYLDASMQTQGQRTEIYRDFAPTQCDDFVDRFLDRVRRGRDEARETKRKLLKPLLDFVEEKKAIHAEQAALDIQEELDKLADSNDMLCNHLSRQLANGKKINTECDEETVIQARRSELEKSSESSWRCSLIGWLDASLNKLIDTFCVTGFNLEAFDLPLLFSRFVVYAKSKNLTVTTGKDGGSLRFLRLDKRVFSYV